MTTCSWVRGLAFGAGMRAVMISLVLVGASTSSGLAQNPAPRASSADLIRRALDANAGLSAARLDVDRARARLRQAGLRPNPSIDFEQRSGRFSGSPGERESSVSVSIPLELFGQRASRLDLSRGHIDAAEASIDEYERKLAAEVRSRYVEALAARHEIEIISALRSIDDETARFVAVRVNEGESAPLEYRLLEVEIARLESRRAAVEGRLQTALVELRALAGLADDEPVTLGEHLARVAWDGAPPLLDEAIKTALATRPDLRLARLEERVAEAGSRLAVSETAPAVSVFGRFSVEQSVFDETPVGVLRDPDRTFSFGVSIGLPIFNRNQGTRAEAEIAVAQARKRREYAEQRVRTEVVSAFARLRAAETAMATFERDVIPRSNDNLRSIRGAYEAGAYRITELLVEQRRFVDSRREFIDTLAERYRALADLQTAMGVVAAFGERPPSASPAIGATPDRDSEQPVAAEAPMTDRLPIAVDEGSPEAFPQTGTKRTPPKRGPKP